MNKTRIGVLTVIFLVLTNMTMSFIQDHVIRPNAWSLFLPDPDHFTKELTGVGRVPIDIYSRLGTFETKRPSFIGKDFFFTNKTIKELFSPTHAQVGLVSINLNISSQTCTQLLTGTTTTKIWVYNGLIAVNAQGTGQLLSFVPGLTNGTGTTCGTNALINASTSTVGTIVFQSTGTSASATTVVSINQGSPAMILPTSSALDVTTATVGQVNGWLTVAQQ